MRHGELSLNRRQCLYVEGVAAGMSRRRAALDAGYSLPSANNPGHNIERGWVRELFGDLIRSAVSPELIAQRVREGLDATETKCFVHEGEVIYSRPSVNFTERRHYTELAARFGGYYVDKQQIEMADEADDLSEDEVIKKAEVLLAALKGNT